MKQRNVYQLTAVDYQILELIKMYHYLTAEQVVRLRYSKNSLTTVQPRLKALSEAGFLLRTRLPSVMVGNSSYVYHLSTKGANVLDADGYEAAGRIRSDDISALHYPFLAHVLALGDVLIAASLLPRSVPSITLSEMRHELDLKKTPIRVNVPDKKLREKVSVVPDAWLDFSWAVPDRAKARRKCIALELDRGTTSINPLKQKLRALYAMAISEEYVSVFGTQLCQVAYITTAGAARLSQLIDWCEQELTESGLEQESGLYLFASLPDGDYTPQELFCSPMWLHPFSSSAVALLWDVK